MTLTAGDRTSPPTGLILILFFASGALALVYQVAWSRLMTHVFGSTALAVGTVIAAFMAGMAIGSWYFGRLADRSGNCLRLYAWIEVGIAVLALLSHLALDALDFAYPWMHEWAGGSPALLGVVRFLLAFALVMAPTVLMGATLPVLTRLLATSSETAGLKLGTLYAVNTFGAVAGVLMTGFFLVGRFGVHVPVYMAVAGNLVVGLVALAVAGRYSQDETGGEHTRSDVPATPLSPAMYRFVLFGLGVSGFTSFSYEIFWTRSLVFILGNSTYALTTMLSAFLTGIALGGWLIRYVMKRSVDHVMAFGAVQVLLGVLSASALPMLFSVTDPQTLSRHVISASGNASGLLFTGYGISFLVMLAPAILIGTTFPLVGSLGIRDRDHAGSAVGRTYAVNTIGNVLGALLPGLVLINWIGIQKGILAMALINTMLGFSVLLARSGQTARPVAWRAALPVLVLLTVFAMSRAPLNFQFPSEYERESSRTLYYREGPLATTKVFEDTLSGEKHMSVDGIVIGGTGLAEYKQLLLAHLPKLLVEDYAKELSVGLGSGILVGESARHPGVERITSVEIEPSVIEGAAWFSEENHDALEHPAIEVIPDDIGNFLRTTDTLYQVITADEKMADEFASNGFSYSLDYYELLRSHLAPGGLAMQWVPTTLPPSQYRMVVKTFTRGFPHVQLWYFIPAYRRGPFNTLLVGSNEPLEIDPGRMDERLANHPAAFSALGRYGLTSSMAVLPHFVASGQRLRDAVSDADMNTLDHPRYEFYYPWDYVRNQERHIIDNQAFLFDLKRNAHAEFAASLELSEADRELFDRTMRAEFVYLFGFQRFLLGMTLEEQYRYFDATLAMAPWNDSLRARIYAKYSYIASSRRSPAERIRLREKARSLYADPQDP